MKEQCSQMDGAMDTQGGFFRELQIEFLIHELKDPLAVIETGLRMVLERQDSFGGLSQKQERTLKRSLRAARKARSMLHGLLEIGRAEAGCFSCRSFPLPSALYGAVMDAVEAMDASAQEGLADGELTPEVLARCGVSVHVDPRLEEVSLYQDEDKFCQIVGNLVKNAIHHRQRKVEVRVAPMGENIALEVTDDGPGIQPEHQEMIFRRYAQVQAPPNLARRGHGLGLAGARILARSLGGQLEVSSQKGKGATFRLVMPLRMERAGEEGEVRPPSE